MPRHTLPAFVLCGLVATSALVGCSGSPNSEVSGPSTVTLLTHDSFAVSQDLIDDFEASTGIHLELMSGGDAGSMTAGAILAAGQPTADVIFGIDNTLVSRALDAGVFESYTSPESPNLEPSLQAGTHDGMVTPIDYGDVCVNIDDEYFAANAVPPPASLDDLADPAYRDLLVVEDPGTSSPGLAFLLATIARYGDGWKDYWQRLVDNGVTVSSSWTDAYEGQFSGGGGGGDHPLVVSYATSPPAEIVYADDPKPTEPSTSVMTDGCYRQVEYAGVLAGTDNPDGARQVVDWLVSPQVQADVPLSMFVFPARVDVSLPDVFTDFAAKIDEPLGIESTEVTAHLSEWLQGWGEVVGR